MLHNNMNVSEKSSVTEGKCSFGSFLIEYCYSYIQMDQPDHFLIHAEKTNWSFSILMYLYMWIQEQLLVGHTFQQMMKLKIEMMDCLTM